MRFAPVKRRHSDPLCKEREPTAGIYRLVRSKVHDEGFAFLSSEPRHQMTPDLNGRNEAVVS